MFFYGIKDAPKTWSLNGFMNLAIEGVQPNSITALVRQWIYRHNYDRNKNRSWEILLIKTTIERRL